MEGRTDSVHESVLVVRCLDCGVVGFFIFVIPFISSVFGAEDGFVLSFFF